MQAMCMNILAHQLNFQFRSEKNEKKKLLHFIVKKYKKKMDCTLSRLLRTLKRDKRRKSTITKENSFTSDTLPPLNVLNKPMSSVAKYRMARSWRQMEADMVKDQYRNFHTFVPRYVHIYATK